VGGRIATAGTTEYLPRHHIHELRLYRFGSRSKVGNRGPCFLSASAIAFYCIRTHGYGTRMLALKAKSGFPMREVPPALRFTKPFPTVLSVNYGALAAQQLHITAAY
jgi:hypothetical protein